MFEKYRARKAQARYEQALQHWQQQRDAQAAALELARTFNGAASNELMLKRGEALMATITNVGLVEMRKGPGRWQGGTSGVSIPVGSLGGHAIRYHVGATRGHYVQGTPHPTAIDTGTAYITTQRVVFKGRSQTRECLFARLLGYDVSDDGSVTLSVSNRQKPVTLFYGAQLNGWVRLRLDLALAHYRQTVPAFVAGLEQGLQQLDAAKPTSAPIPAG